MNAEDGVVKDTKSKKSAKSSLKCLDEYLAREEKDAKNSCKKIHIYPDPNVLDVVKNVMWAAGKFVDNLPKIRNKCVNIYTQWVGDPDAIASAQALRELFLINGANDGRILCGKIGHPQNLEMLEICNIVKFNPNDGRFVDNEINCIVDASPPLGTKNTVMIQNPPTEFYFVCDHHNTSESVRELCEEFDVKSITIPIVGKRVGATSTMIAFMVSHLRQLDKITPETKAALLLGIYSDTSGLMSGVTTLDSAMFNLLNVNRTSEIFASLNHYQYPEDWLKLKHRAYVNQVSTGRVRLTTTGLTPDNCRDVIAECANDIIRQQGTAISFCLAVTMDGLDLSVRANSYLLRMEPQRIVKVVDDLFNTLFPGKSGFKFSNSFPHNVEGGACIKLETIDQVLLGIKEKNPDYKNEELNKKNLSRCREYIEAIVKVLKDMAAEDPELMAGLGLESKKEVVDVG